MELNKDSGDELKNTEKFPFESVTAVGDLWTVVT
jgi:hypothetical protein